MFPVDVLAESDEEVPKLNCGLAIEDWVEHMEDLVRNVRVNYPIRQRH